MLHRPTHPNGYVSHEFPQFCGNWARKKKKNSTQIPTQKAKKKIIKTSAMNSTVHFPLVVTRLPEAMGAQKPIKPKHQDFKGKDFDHSDRSQTGVPEAIACLQKQQELWRQLPSAKSVLLRASSFLHFSCSLSR